MNEEYAIDAVMHKLWSLEELYVSGDLLTPLSIARKRRRDGPPASSTFMATVVPGIYLEGIIEALEVSEWNVVSIKTLPGFVDGDELLLKESALKVAARRGIALMYQPVF
ncbi:hypothetical protein H0H93_012730 [Arthromyces matolae]|nr:hypothetical protein H0H93_012730 [Arthromyces matolae]